MIHNYIVTVLAVLFSIIILIPWTVFIVLLLLLYQNEFLCNYIEFESKDIGEMCLLAILLVMHKKVTKREYRKRGIAQFNRTSMHALPLGLLTLYHNEGIRFSSAVRFV